MNQLQFVVFTNCVDYDGFKHQILNFGGFEFFFNSCICKILCGNIFRCFVLNMSSFEFIVINLRK